jgi:signal peptidase I
MSEEKEQVFDDNVEIIDYDINDQITVDDFNKNDKPPVSEDSFDVKSEIFSWIKMIISAAVIAFVIVEFIIINATVPTGSMENTILPGDRIMGSRLTYLFKEPERGDIVVFKYQFEENTDYVKRIIGLPGETVSIENGQIFIYKGDELVEGPLKEDYLKEEWTWKNNGYTFTIPEGRYLVLGDNRNNSKDARYWYDEYFLNNTCSENEVYVSEDQILGKVYFRYWSKEVTSITEKFKNLNK